MNHHYIVLGAIVSGAVAVGLMYRKNLLALAATQTGATHTVSKQGSLYVSSTGIKDTDAVNVIQGTINSMQPGSVLNIAPGNYPIVSDYLYIPNTDNLTIQGVGDSTVLDATANHLNENVKSSANTDLGIIGRSSQDNTHLIGNKIINNLTIRNMRLIGSQTGPKYLANNLNMAGIRADNVNNLWIENTHTNFTGISVQVRNVNAATIRGCKSYNDAAGPAITDNSHNVLVDNCYVYRSMDDSFAVLGATGIGTYDVEFRNCIADKGKADSSSSSVGASCFKIDSATSHKIHDIKYVNCKAFNGKPGVGRPEIEGGFITGDPTISNITFESCIADNCKTGYQIAGANNVLTNCTATNCEIPIATQLAVSPQIQGGNLLTRTENTKKANLAIAYI